MSWRGLSNRLQLPARDLGSIADPRALLHVHGHERYRWPRTQVLDVEYAHLPGLREGVDGL